MSIKTLIKGSTAVILASLFLTGCAINLQEGISLNKIKGDLTNAVSGKVSESVQEGVSTGIESAKDELVNELNAKEIKISSDNIDPKTITVLQNEEVKLKIISSDTKTHGFYLPDYEITETVKDNETQIITFKAEKTGTFEYSCNINCQTGIKGNLIVK